MRDTPVHIANERVKAVASIGYNLATGLFAAGAARAWSDAALTLVSAIWIGGGFLLTWLAAQLLSLLQSED